ncbi:MAG: fatty acid desaturase family protein [Solirubrobacteraceae bacterium]
MTVSPIERLSPEQLDQICAELDAIRDQVMADLGEDDARYIRNLLKTQRTLELGGRAALLVSLFPPAWLAGTAALSVAKILENMEIGHNVMHGQWDWMRDPEIHSSTWEWDNVSPADAWKRAHNFEHHTFTNIVGKDRDLGYEILRVDAKQPWHPIYLAQPLYHLLMGAFFEWGVAIHDTEFDEAWHGRKPWSSVKRDVMRLAGKARRQVLKDYIVWPALAGPSAVPAFLGSFSANIARNVWAQAVIFCGHFPSGAETFEYTEEQFANETRGEWYVRQMLGSVNIDGSRLLHIMTGNLSYQIEHHLFPDVPSNRYHEIAPRVQEICERYELPYTSGPLLRQYGEVLLRIARYAFPGGESADSSDAGRAHSSDASREPAPTPASSVSGAKRLKAVAA